MNKAFLIWTIATLATLVTVAFMNGVQTFDELGRDIARLLPVERTAARIDTLFQEHTPPIAQSDFIFAAVESTVVLAFILIAMNRKVRRAKMGLPYVTGSVVALFPILHLLLIELGRYVGACYALRVDHTQVDLEAIKVRLIWASKGWNMVSLAAMIVFVIYVLRLRNRPKLLD